MLTQSSVVPERQAVSRWRPVGTVRSAGLRAARAARFADRLAASVRTERPQGAQWVMRRARKPSTGALSSRSEYRHW